LRTAAATSTKRLSAGAVRIGTSLGVPIVLRRFGADPTQVLAEVGLDLKLFEDPDNQLSFAARGHLLAHCAERLGCPHFGLLVGQLGDLHSLGLLGLLAKYSPDVGTALGSLSRYSQVYARGATITLAAAGRHAAFGYEIYQPGVQGTGQIGDGAMAVSFNVMRTLCGPEWKPVEVRLAHRRPRNVAPYREFFQAPVIFDTGQNALVFPAKWLTRRLPDVDPQLRRLLQEQVDALEYRHGEDFPERVRSMLRAALLTGHATAEAVAALFGMHSRTLNRRLNAFGTRFRDIVDECRFEVARQMLEDSTMQMGQIAELLDYTDPSTFTKAFRRWSGTTPTQWRVTNRYTRLGARRAMG
jgi:AraC-like DNA-binding protein